MYYVQMNITIGCHITKTIRKQQILFPWQNYFPTIYYKNVFY